MLSFKNCQLASKDDLLRAEALFTTIYYLNSSANASLQFLSQSLYIEHGESHRGLHLFCLNFGPILGTVFDRIKPREIRRAAIHFYLISNAARYRRLRVSIPDSLHFVPLPSPYGVVPLGLAAVTIK